jgi:hypothetical protein
LKGDLLFEFLRGDTYSFKNLIDFDVLTLFIDFDFEGLLETDRLEGLYKFELFSFFYNLCNSSRLLRGIVDVKLILLIYSSFLGSKGLL